MSFSKSATALAIVFAVPIFSSQIAVAEPFSEVVLAKIPDDSRVEKTTKKDKKQPKYDKLHAAVRRFVTPPPAPKPIVKRTFTPLSVARFGGTAGNSYVWGNCTWYVKERKPNLPNLLGNAGYRWLDGARAAGFATGNTPRAGAIGVSSHHVVIVESVNSNGTINISEMNYDQVGKLHYRTVAASMFKYIYA